MNPYSYQGQVTSFTSNLMISSVDVNFHRFDFNLSVQDKILLMRNSIFRQNYWEAVPKTNLILDMSHHFNLLEKILHSSLQKIEIWAVFLTFIAWFLQLWTILNFSTTRLKTRLGHFYLMFTIAGIFLKLIFALIHNFHSWNYLPSFSLLWNSSKFQRNIL